MISNDQQKALANLVFQQLEVNVTVGFLQTTFPTVDLHNIRTQDRTIAIANWIVDQVLRAPSPTGFIDLVEVAVGPSGGLPSVSTLADELAANPRSWVPLGSVPSFDWSIEEDPLDIPDGRPFIDRKGFREKLPRAGATQSPNCLLVKGDTKGGKSYLHDFCKALKESRQGFSVGYTYSFGLPPADVEVRMIANELSFGLNTDQRGRPDPHEEPERDAENLARWIAHYTPESPVPAVAILDEFSHPDLAESVHRFILELAGELQRNETVRAKLRLVLTDYDEGRLSKAGISFESYVLEPIGAPDIADWLRKRFPQQPDYRYDQAATTIVGAAARYPAGQRMLFLNQLVRSAARDF
jgi:hypothetical protein